MGEAKTGSALVITMGCKNGHKVNVDEATAKRINLTACAVCYKPLFVKGVKAGGK